MSSQVGFITHNYSHRTLISKQVHIKWILCELKSDFNQQVHPSERQTDPLRLRCSPSRELWGGFVEWQQSFQSDQDDPGPGRDPDHQAGGFPEQSGHRGGPSAFRGLPGGVWLQRRARGISSWGHCVLRLQTAVYRLSDPELWLQVKARLEEPPSINHITDRVLATLAVWSTTLVQTEISQQMLNDFIQTCIN